MTYDSQELLTLFGRLFQQRAFVAAAVHSSRFNNDEPQRQSNQLRLLQLLREQDHLTNSEIVEALDIRPSSVSALVNKLADADLIEREVSPDDKRVTLISLSEAGDRFLKTAHKTKDEFSESLFQTLSATEQTQLRESLQKLLKDLETKQPGDWDHAADFRTMMTQAQAMHRGRGMGMRGMRGHGPMGMGGCMGPGQFDADPRASRDED